MKNYKGQGMCNWFDYNSQNNEEKDSIRRVKRHDEKVGFLFCDRSNMFLILTENENK